MQFPEYQVLSVLLTYPHLQNDLDSLIALLLDSPSSQSSLSFRSFRSSLPNFIEDEKLEEEEGLL
jgi:hypothetical protein